MLLLYKFTLVKRYVSLAGQNVRVRRYSTVRTLTDNEASCTTYVDTVMLGIRSENNCSMAAPTAQRIVLMMKTQTLAIAYAGSSDWTTVGAFMLGGSYLVVFLFFEFIYEISRGLLVDDGVVTAGEGLTARSMRSCAKLGSNSLSPIKFLSVEKSCIIGKWELYRCGWFVVRIFSGYGRRFCSCRRLVGERRFLLRM